MSKVEGREWMRVCGAIDGFRQQFGRSPTKILLHKRSLQVLRESTLTPESFDRVCSMIEFVTRSKNPHIIAADDEGHQYNYSLLGFPETEPDVTALEWFGHPELRDSDVEDGFAIACKPNYLGSPDVVRDLMMKYFEATLDGKRNPESVQKWDEANTKLATILCGDVEDYPAIPGWHNVHSLGKAVIKYFNMDEGYYDVDDMLTILIEGLAALSVHIMRFLDAFDADKNAEWIRDAVLQLDEMCRFACAVVMGTNAIYYPDKSLDDFVYRQVG